MQYTAPEVILIITAIGAIIQNTVTIWRTSNKVGATLTKATVIEGHVNGQSTRYDEKMISYRKEIEILMQVITDKDRTIALLTQSKAAPVISIEGPLSLTHSIDIAK